MRRLKRLDTAGWNLRGCVGVGGGYLSRLQKESLYALSQGETGVEGPQKKQKTGNQILETSAQKFQGRGDSISGNGARLLRREQKHYAGIDRGGRKGQSVIIQ